MKRKTLKYLNQLFSTKRHNIHNANSHLYINSLQKAPQSDPLSTGPQQYVQNQLEVLNFKQQIQDESQIKVQFQNVWNQKLRQIQKLKSYQLAKVIQRLNRNFAYGQIQEARQILSRLNIQQKKQLKPTLQLFESFLKANVNSKKQTFQSHTITAAQNLIQELKRVRKVDEL